MKRNELRRRYAGGSLSSDSEDDALLQPSGLSLSRPQRVPSPASTKGSSTSAMSASELNASPPPLAMWAEMAGPA